MSWNLWASWIPNFERCVYASIGQRSFLTILGHINKSNSRCHGLIDFREWFYINKHPSWQIILKSSAESCLLFKNPMDRYLKSGCNTAGPKLPRGVAQPAARLRMPWSAKFLKCHGLISTALACLANQWAWQGRKGDQYLDWMTCDYVSI